MKLFEKIVVQRAPTIREEAFKYLRQQIVTGEIGPGTKLIESKLAKEMGTSRTPVREALHNLEMENLIQSIPRVGYVVREISEEEIEEIIEIRVALEILAAKRAASRITSKELSRLQKILQNAGMRLDKGDTRGLVELNTEFHEIICKASRSSRMLEISQNLRDHMLRYRMMSLGMAEIARRALEGHCRILEAIIGRDMEAIESAVHHHLDQTKTDIIRTIRG